MRCHFMPCLPMLANSGDTDQTPHYEASDLGLHCLSMYPFSGFPTTMR